MNAITLPKTIEQPQETTLRDCVRLALERYFANLDGERPVDLYNIVLEEIELPLLKVVMDYTRGNQVKASKVLGIARGTLRTKLKKHGMLDGNE